MKKTMYAAVLILLGAGLLMIGCGSEPEDPTVQGSGDGGDQPPARDLAARQVEDADVADAAADVTPAMKKLQAEADKMSDKELMASAQKYVDAMHAQEKQAEALAQKLMQMTLAEAAGDKRDEIQAEAEKLGQAAEEIQANLQVLLEEMTSRNLDMTQLKWENPEQ